MTEGEVFERLRRIDERLNHTAPNGWRLWSKISAAAIIPMAAAVAGYGALQNEVGHIDERSRATAEELREIATTAHGMDHRLSSVEENLGSLRHSFGEIDERMRHLERDADERHDELMEAVLSAGD